MMIDVDRDEIEDIGISHSVWVMNRPGRPQPIEGAAAVLLSNQAEWNFPQIVLEGAPGQGKSTILQYVCQVLRMHILNETADLALIPEMHRAIGKRIPFRAELRDLALWFRKKNPFSSQDNSAVPENWRKSLESFLAAQVQ
jgi:hypothetical protein